MPTGRKISQAEADHDRMRCVVDETGTVVFASPAVGWSLGMAAGALTTKPISSILSIVSSHSGQKTLNFSGLDSGFYDVALLRRERDPLLVQARIDLVDAP